MPFLDLLAGKAKELHGRFLSQLDGRGDAAGAEEMWEAQYLRGDYDFLYWIEEIGHYMIIVGYIPYLHPSPAILDVGCGQGRLFELLRATPFQSYLGIDVSPTAIQKASRVAADRARFEVADFETWKAAHRFDIIILNESLYCARRPLSLLRRCARWLTRKGSLIVSMYRCAAHLEIWDSLDPYFVVVDSNMVQNRRGQIWDIRIVRPRRALQVMVRKWVRSAPIREFVSRITRDQRWR